MHKHFLVCFILSFLSFHSSGQATFTDKIDYTAEDMAIFDRFLTKMEPQKHLPTDQLIIETASFFLGTPYVAATLEKEPERLVVNLREMDCATFVDNVIALSRMLKSMDHSFESFCLQLQSIRYRNEEIADYTDRLHYTSDWLYVNDQQRIIKDINKEIGGSPLCLKLDFMSTHPESYKQLKSNPEFVKKMAAIEKEINNRSFYYIPKQAISTCAPRMQNGDIVCFTTAIKGLDTSHMGIITRVDDKLTFIHASSLAKKVIVNEESLLEYIQKGKNNTGIMLARVILYSNNSKETLKPIR